jgi:hypothetical protein
VGGWFDAGREVSIIASNERQSRYFDPITKTGPDGLFELRCICAGEQHNQAVPFWLDAERAPGLDRSRDGPRRGRVQAGRRADGEPVMLNGPPSYPPTPDSEDWPPPIRAVIAREDRDGRGPAPEQGRARLDELPKHCSLLDHSPLEPRRLLRAGGRNRAGHSPLPRASNGRRIGACEESALAEGGIES